MRTLLVLGLMLLGCDDPVAVGGGGGGAGAATKVATPDGGSTDAGGTASGGATGTPPAADPNAMSSGLEALELPDEKFVEADTNRDPFRSYLENFREITTPHDGDIRVIMEDLAIEQMRLIAIVTSISQPRAMLVDARGVGHVVQRGDFLGRPEVFRTGGEEAMPVTLNWRVDRIRPNEVVLVRQDPTAPDRPGLTRVIALHDENERNPALERGEIETEQDDEGENLVPAPPDADPTSQPFEESEPEPEPEGELMSE